MVSPWVKEELATANLQDKRLNDLFRELLTSWSERPRASIAAACGGNAEMTAAYRFCDNQMVTLPQLLAPHREATLKRIAAQDCVVLSQDTTEVDLTRPDMLVEGVGPLSDESRVGAFLKAVSRNGSKRKRISRPKRARLTSNSKALPIKLFARTPPALSSFC